MAPTIRELTFASIAFALGAWAFVKTQEVSGPAFKPILAACTDFDISLADFSEKTGYHAYEPKLGLVVMGPFVCLITQFLYELNQTYPAGLLTWAGIVIASLPVAVLITIEAGRSGRGPVRDPIIVSLFCQVLGISVIFPALWVPAYCFGRGQGAVSETRARASIPLLMPGLILSVLVFCLDTDSYAWTISAGILGGPILALLPVFLWGVAVPENSKEQRIQGARAASFAYIVAGVIAFFGWWFLVYVAWSSYGTDHAALWKDLWTDAKPCVAFMTIDAGVLWLAMVICIAFQSLPHATEALLMTPLFGPGAACSFAMARLEVENPSSSADDKTKKE
jgi:hypothetical protein